MTSDSGQSDHSSLIRLRNVWKSFGSAPVLQGLDLDVPRGSTVVILGPSGAGKSVTLKIIIGLLDADQGQIEFDGQRVDLLEPDSLRDMRRRIGFLFQQGALFDSLTVLENVAFPLREHTSLSAEIRREKVCEALTLLGIEDLVDRLPSELSGGQRKRVALARAIVLQPECILYDEPTTGLDPIRSDVVAKLITMLRESLRPTSVVVTHDIPLAFKVADHLLLLREGTIHFSGPPIAFKETEDPIVRAFLDGDSNLGDEVAA